MYNFGFYIKRYFSLLFSSVIFWCLAFSFFIMIRYFAFKQEITATNTKQLPITQWLDFGIWIGVILGVFYGTIEFFFERYILKKQSIFLIIIEKAILYLIVLILSTTFISFLVESRLNKDIPNASFWWIRSNTFWLVVGYFIIMSQIFAFYKMANKKFGNGVLFNLLIGYYKNPQEEKRIFMFLDLKSSTAIAEQLGHLKYSRLIQDCFYDLNMVLNRYSAEVYQYVGDEAVINWKYKRGLRNNNCLRIYFAFDYRIQRRKKYYLKKYGVLPNFKAGVHGGILTVTEVGVVKKEIAYHGDVINTCSRIQEECNTYDVSLLISDDIFKEIKKTKYKFNNLGNILLKGKEEPLKIYSVDNLD